MTYERREEIFSKEVITLSEMEELLSLSKSAASLKMKEMKRKVGDRLGIIGRIHIQDYIDWLELEKDAHLDRYKKPMSEEAVVKKANPVVINL